MGYESRLYVVEKCNTTENVNGKSLKWAEVVAMIDLCKCYPVSDKMRKYPETDAFFYDSADKKVTEDLYGEPLREIPLSDAIQIVGQAMESGYYRRYEPAMGLLKGFNADDWGDLVVLHYGH